MESLQAGLLMRANVALDSPHLNAPTVRHRMPQWLQAGNNDPHRQRIMDNAQEFRDLSMLEARSLCTRQHWGNGTSNRIDMLQAAFGSGAVSQLFGATIGARLLASYAEISDFSLGWTQEAENPTSKSTIARAWKLRAIFLCTHQGVRPIMLGEPLYRKKPRSIDYSPIIPNRRSGFDER